jgi:aldehyde dehydrogenase
MADLGDGADLGASAGATVDERILIDGEWVDRGDGRLTVLDPADEGQVVGTVPHTSPVDVDLAVRAASRAFQRWSRTAMAERAELLARAAASVLEDLEPRAVLLVRESGKVIAEARGEIRAGSGVLAYYGSLGTSYQQVEPLPSPNGRVLVAREPMGVAAVIVPWNAPILLGFLAVAPALLAGNTVVVKPSTEAPLALCDFIRVVSRHLPPGVLNVVTGSADVGHALATHPLVRRVMFTGSTEVGRTVAADAIASLKRVSLELGGNDPALVLDDVDLDGDAVSEIVNAVYPTSGQVCYAIKRIYVQASRYQEFVRRFVEASSALMVGNGLDPRSDLGPLINRRQVAFVESLVADARDRGAEVRVVGERLDPSTWDRGCFHLPTVITGVDHSFRVVECEQFGPVIPIIPFDTEDEGIALANDTAFGLASSIWTSDEERGMSLARRIEAGSTFVNVHRPGASGVDMPFGGFKESGLGRGHGVVALEEQFELHTISTRRPPAPPLIQGPAGVIA